MSMTVSMLAAYAWPSEVGNHPGKQTSIAGKMPRDMKFPRFRAQFSWGLNLEKRRTNPHLHRYSRSRRAAKTIQKQPPPHATFPSLNSLIITDITGPLIIGAGLSSMSVKAFRSAFFYLLGTLADAIYSNQGDGRK